MENDKPLPRPTGKVVDFARLQTFEQAMDYALGGHHASLEQASRQKGPQARLWQDAADKYRAAYLAMFPLKTMPEDQGFARAKELLDEANHLADVAKVGANA